MERTVRTAPVRTGEQVWWTAAVGAAVLSAVLVVAGLLPVGTTSTAPVPGLALALAFEPEVVADIAAYRVPRRMVSLASRIVAVLVPVLLALVLTRDPGERLLRRLTGTARFRRRRGVLPDALPVALPVGAVIAVAIVVTALVRLPFSVWAGVVQDGAWGFRTRSVPGWALDHLVVVGGRALMVGLLVAGIVVVVRRHPRTWPARLTVAVALVGPLLLLLHPLVVHPLLLPTGPLPDGPHREAVAAIVARSSSPDVVVLVGEASRRTTRRNAVVTGLGPTQRIVLHDTLLDLDPREVAAITAHELAHIERRDPLRGVLAPVPIVLLLGLAARRRLAGLPREHHLQVRALAVLAVAALAVESAATPLSAAMSRTIEHRTDVRAVELTGDSSAYVAMLRAFVIDGLAEPDPPRWSVLLWATHPTPAVRIGVALDAEARLSEDLGPATR
jgi:STE24 endopeptidase